MFAASAQRIARTVGPFVMFRDDPMGNLGEASAFFQNRDAEIRVSFDEAAFGRAQLPSFAQQRAR
jgi:hypothetical protein